MDLNKFRGEWVAFWGCVLLFLLAIFMFVMAILDTVNPNIARMEHTTTSNAWYASFVMALIARFSISLLNWHTNKKLARIKKK